MVIAAFTARTRSTSIATTKSTASGAAAQATGTVAYTPPTRYIGMAPAGTSASGVARRRMVPAAYIRRLVATRSREPFILGKQVRPVFPKWKSARHNRRKKGDGIMTAAHTPPLSRRRGRTRRRMAPGSSVSRSASSKRTFLIRRLHCHYAGFDLDIDTVR